MATESDHTDMKRRMAHKNFPKYGVLAQISAREMFITRALQPWRR
jgi:hypothetical protein